MKLFHTLALTALLLVPGTAAQALDVQVDVCVQTRSNNKCAIKQDGTHNTARATQVGDDNDLEIEQTGSQKNDARFRQRQRRR